MMNPVAEFLTGWTQSEAQGQPLATVFPIFNEQTRKPVENPVEKVLREGVIVGLGQSYRVKGEGRVAAADRRQRRPDSGRVGQNARCRSNLSGRDGATAGRTGVADERGPQECDP